MARDLRSGLMLLALVAAAALATVAQGSDTSVITGLPRPMVQPSCGPDDAGFYGDMNGCVYSCSSSKHSVIAAPLDAPCVFPTTGATPTATATATPTPTVTSTP